MWKIHRYYLREILTSLALAFGVLFGIVMLAMVPRGLEKAQGFGLWNAVKITTLWSLDAFPHLFPVTLVFAIVLTYARAGQDREITAIRAAGVSPRVAATPALMAGIGCSLIGSVLLHYLVPQTHFAKNRVVADSIRSVMTGTGMLGDSVQFEGMQMTWEHRDALGHWHGVQIVLSPERGRDAVDDGNLEGQEIVIADEAFVELSPSGEDLVLVLRNAQSYGATRAYSGDSRLTVSVRSLTQGRELEEADQDMATDQLIAEVLRGVHREPLVAMYEAHRRSAFALLPTLLAPIAFCIGVLARSRGRVFALVLGIVPIVIAFASDVVARSLFRDAQEPLLAWLPSLVLVALGVPFCWRLLRF